MNISLSPQKQLGRMLHDFSATAYEIADYNLYEIKKYELLPADNLNEEG